MGHTKPLNIVLWNATSVRNKKQELHKFLIDDQIDIALITETWLAPNDPFHLPDYNITRKDRNKQQGRIHAGGVLIATHIPIDHPPPQPGTTSIEAVTIHLKTSPAIIIGAAYVLPTQKITPTEQITAKNSTQLYLIWW